MLRWRGRQQQDMGIIEAVKKIRGPEGTKVNLTIVREGMAKPLKLSIIRGVIPLKSVRHYVLSPGIGYVRISNFQNNTSNDLSSALEILDKDGKLKGLIIGSEEQSWRAPVPGYRSF